MVLLGLILLVLAALLTVGVVLNNTAPENVDLFLVTLADVSLGAMFAVGVITGIVGTLGLMLMLGGSLRRRHKKVAAKRERREVDHRAETLEEENTRLAAELERERDARAYPPDPAAPVSPASGVEPQGQRRMFRR